MKLRDRIKSLRRVRAGDLRPNPRNWRIHPQAQQDALRGVLAEVGIADALLARELPDGSLMLIDGHLRADVDPDVKWPVLIRKPGVEIPQGVNNYGMTLQARDNGEEQTR